MNNEVQHWYNLVTEYASQSKCRSRQVGAIIVTEEGRTIAQGWNSPPRKTNVDDCIRCNRKDAGDDIPSGTSSDTSICCHAEANCIASCVANHISTRNCTIICLNKPCNFCAASIVGARISKVVYFEEYHSLYAELMFKNAGIECVNFSDKVVKG